MRLLDRYLLRELLFPLFLCLGGFSILWIAVDLQNELPRLQAAQLTGVEMAEYYICKLPDFLTFPIVPVSLLLALLYTLTTLARHHELVAMRAAGISLWRLSFPYFAVGLLFSLGLLFLNEVFAPGSAAAAQEVLNRHVSQDAGAAERQWHRNLNFSNDSRGRIWNIVAYNTNTAEMKELRVEWSPPDNTKHYLFADHAILTNGVWTFYGVKLMIYDPPAYDIARRIMTNVMAMPEFDETPELIKSEIKVSQMNAAMAAKKIRFTLAEILNFKQLHPQLKQREPERYAMLQTQFHGRLAQPWISLIVVAIAIPFGALSGRRNVVVGVASSIFICFAYFVLAQLGFNLGTGGRLPAWLAAWLPNLLFGAGGIWFTLRAR